MRQIHPTGGCSAPQSRESQGIRIDRSALGNRGDPRGEMRRHRTFHLCERRGAARRDVGLHRGSRMSHGGGIRVERTRRHHPAALVRAGSGTPLAVRANPVLLARGKDPLNPRRRTQAGAGHGRTDVACAGAGGGESGYRRPPRRGACHSGDELRSGGVARRFSLSNASRLRMRAKNTA